MDHPAVTPRPYYLIPLATLENVTFRLVPITCTAPTITIETNPAIRAYSTAVAPDSLLQNRLTICAMLNPISFNARRGDYTLAVLCSPKQG
jgi:hypothetical protein